jgi:hypothetical protein
MMVINMTENITRQTLAFAIFALAFDRCRLTDQIDRATSEEEEEGHLCDTLMNMERSLGELRGYYSAYRDELSEQDNYDALCANAEEDYKQFCEEQRKLSAV